MVVLIMTLLYDSVKVIGRKKEKRESLQPGDLVKLMMPTCQG
jgi:hypothetical protein